MSKDLSLAPGNFSLRLKASNVLGWAPECHSSPAYISNKSRSVSSWPHKPFARCSSSWKHTSIPLNPLTSSRAAPCTQVQSHTLRTDRGSTNWPRAHVSPLQNQNRGGQSATWPVISVESSSLRVWDWILGRLRVGCRRQEAGWALGGWYKPATSNKQYVFCFDANAPSLPRTKDSCHRGPLNRGPIGLSYQPDTPPPVKHPHSLSLSLSLTTYFLPPYVAFLYRTRNAMCSISLRPRPGHTTLGSARLFVWHFISFNFGIIASKSH